MNKKVVLLGLPLVLLIAVIAGINPLPRAHASGFPIGPGTICLLDSSSVGSLAAPGPCATLGPYAFNGPFPSAPQTGSTQLRVGVYVNGSAGLNGFDITLLSNSSVLAPVGVDLTGSILFTATGSPTSVLECAGTTLITGSSCSSTDNPDTLHFAAATAPGGFVAGPATGLLFTAIYEIVGTSSGPQSLGFQSGCGSATSVQGGICVTISNGTTSPDLETVQTASFDNSSCASTCTIPWVAITSNLATVTVPQGASSGNVVNLFANAENGWPGLSTDMVTFTTTQTSGFGAPTFAGGNSCSTNGISCSVNMTVSDSNAGTYFITVYGAYVALDSTTSTTDTLSGTLILQVDVQAVSWTIDAVSASSAQSIYMAQGASNPLNLIFTAKSLGGYTGTITYQTSTLSDGGTGVALSYPAPFVLASGATVRQTVQAAATSYGTALYHASLITSTPTLVNQTSGVLSIHVTGFEITASSANVTFAAFGSASDSITVQSLPANNAGFAGKITISHSTAGGSLTVTCPASLVLAAGGTATGSCGFSGSTAGTFAVAIGGVGGTNGAITNTTIINVTVTSVQPSFSITASPSSLTSRVNSNPFSTISVTASGGLSGTVSLSSTSSPMFGVTCTFSNTGIPLPTGKVTFSCSSPNAGTYFVTVNGLDGTVSNSVILTFTFTDFTMSASPSIVNTTPGFPGSSTIIVAPVDGFTDSVGLSSLVSPSSGLTCSLAPATTVGGNGTSELSCTGVGGTYAVTVTGTDANLSHSTTVTFEVADFTLSVSPGAITVPVGPPAGTTMVTIGTIGGFAGTVTLTATASAGFSMAFNPTSLTIAGTSLLTIGVSPPATPGVYLVNVTGTSNVLTHTVTVTVNVTSASSIPPPFFTQSTWNHRFSLSKYSNIQTWTFGVKSNSTSTIYVSVTLTAATSGGTPLSLTTPVFTLSHNKNLVNISLSQTFSASQIGETYSFALVIQWGTAATMDPSQLPFTSALTNGAPTSGTFTILP